MLAVLAHPSDYGIFFDVIYFKLRRLWRIRPRLLTLALLMAIAAMIAIANLTDEFSDCGRDVLVGPGQVQFSRRDPVPDPLEGTGGTWKSLSYGWPLVWRQYILWRFWMGPLHVLDECYSPSRLAFNSAIWLVLLAVPGAACEWLLRQRRPRFQWSLRAMLAAVGLAAALCGWFVAARSRADLQDAVIAAGSMVWVSGRRESGCRLRNGQSPNLVPAVIRLSRSTAADVARRRRPHRPAGPRFPTHWARRARHLHCGATDVAATNAARLLHCSARLQGRAGCSTPHDRATRRAAPTLISSTISRR